MNMNVQNEKIIKKNITVKEILEVTNGELVVGDPNEICENFCFDTRKLQKEDTYIALKGENVDGSNFWKEAFSAGARTAIVNNIDFTETDILQYKSKTIIKVSDTLKALWQIATLKRKLYQIPVIGITGSVGKTSTKDIIASVVSEKYKTLKTEGNNNNHIGVPKTILRLKDEEAAVVEMGMNHFGEISALTKIAKPTLSVITNIGTSHIGNLGSRENILKAKLEILEGMEEKNLIINNDNDLLHSWYEENKEKYNIITYGIHNKSDFMAEEITLNENSSEFICDIDGEKVKIKVLVGGEHFIYNALCAIAVGKRLNIDNKKIALGIQQFNLTKNRMEVIKLKNDVTLINDAYNSSYESTKEALKYIHNFGTGRKIAVLGDVLELGKFAKQLHEKIGEEVAKQNIDILICCGENAKYICEKAIYFGMPKENIYYEKNIQDVISRIEKNIKNGDIILVKASHGMEFIKIVNELASKFM